MTLTINPKAVSAAVAAEPDSYVYTGEAITPIQVVVKDGNTVIPASEYTVEYSNNTNLGKQILGAHWRDDSRCG